MIAKFEVYDYSIGGWWLPAIINDDYTGLSDEEAAQLNDWLADQPDGCWVVDSDEAGFTTDEVTGLKGDCYDVKLIKEV